MSLAKMRTAAFFLRLRASVALMRVAAWAGDRGLPFRGLWAMSRAVKPDMQNVIFAR